MVASVDACADQREDRGEAGIQHEVPRVGRLADEDGSSVGVEDLAGAEAGVGSAEEEDRTGNLVGIGDAAERDGGVDASGDGGVGEGGGGHVGGDPAGSDAVGVDALRGELGGEALGEGDEGALAGGIVGVEGLAARGGGGGDVDDVAAGGGGFGVDSGGGLVRLIPGISGGFSGGNPCLRIERWGTRWWWLGERLGQHLGGGGLDQAEDAVEIDAQGGAPLGDGHGVDGGVVRRPDAVVDDEDVEAAKGLDGGGDEGVAVFGGGERLLEGDGAGFGGEDVGGAGGGEVAEGDAGAGLAEEPHSGRADAARATGDESGAAGEREGDAGEGGGSGCH